jgi:hypothetical protein
MNGLSEDQCATILVKIDCFYTELLGKYEEEKYNEQEYERLCSTFRLPEKIVKKDIEDALAWKYGKTHDNLLKNPKYDGIISSFVDGWSSFLEDNAASGGAVFNFWNDRIGSSFISVAFIAHLIYPKEFPIVDQHTFRAIRYFLDHVGFAHGVRKVPGSIEEIHTLKEFVNSFAKRKNVSLREFDKYMMMFGKHVAPR